jgi:hypothetical protein
MALRQGPDGPAGGHPETGYVDAMPAPTARTIANRLLPLALLGGALALGAGAALAWAAGRGRRRAVK